MASAAIARSIIIVFGLLYPAYNSYKAIKTRNVSLYVKWMMYWIVFALFYNVETITDLMMSWLPMYYELKIIFVIWLLSPATQGAEVLYGMYIHPRLVKHEQEIDETIAKVRSQSYSTLLNVGAKGMNMALQGAIMGQSRLAEQLRKSYSLEDSTDGRQSLTITELPPDQNDDDAELMTRSLTSLDRTPAEMHADSSLRHRHVSSSTSNLSPRQTSRQNQTPRPKFTIDEDELRSYGPLRRRTEIQSHRRSGSGDYLELSYHRQSSPSPASRRTATQDEPIRRTHASGHTSARLSTRQSEPSLTKQQQRPGRSAHIAKPVSRKPCDTSSVKQPKSTAHQPSNPTEEDSPRTTENKAKYTESTLRYRTKKISDIKHQKIGSPFISMW